LSVSTRKFATVAIVLLSIALVLTLSAQWIKAAPVPAKPCSYTPRISARAPSTNLLDELSLPEPMPTMPTICPAPLG
jgi:hypothetical protein